MIRAPQAGVNVVGIAENLEAQAVLMEGEETLLVIGQQVQAALVHAREDLAADLADDGPKRANIARLERTRQKIVSLYDSWKRHRAEARARAQMISDGYSYKALNGNGKRPA